MWCWFDVESLCLFCAHTCHCSKMAEATPDPGHNTWGVKLRPSKQCRGNHLWGRRLWQFGAFSKDAIAPHKHLSFVWKDTQIPDFRARQEEKATHITKLRAVLLQLSDRTARSKELSEVKRSPATVTGQSLEFLPSWSSVHKRHYHKLAT